MLTKVLDHKNVAIANIAWIGPIIWLVIIPVTLLASTQEWTGIGTSADE